jgi:type IV pilus assembly protein PilW
MHKAARSFARVGAAARGFTLIELMVGLLVGMLTVLVIAEALAVSEAKRRTIASGSDAQINGAMSLYTLQREAQMAGYGAASNLSALGCSVKAQFATDAPFTVTLAPVVIDDGLNGMPDTLTFLRGRTTGFSVPIELSGAHTQTADHFAVASSFGATPGNLMIAVPKLQSPTTWCTLFSVTDDPSAPETTLSPAVIPHLPGAKGKWNQTNLFPEMPYERGDYLLNMGAMLSRSYSIGSSNSVSSLRVEERSPVNGSMSLPQDLYPQIVNLQAMYGKGTIDPSGNVMVDTYDSTTPLNNADWQKVVAIRIALVSRSIHYEKEQVTQSFPQWDVGTTANIGPATTPCKGNAASKCIPIKVDHLGVGEDWKHFRYKIFDTIIPLRNVLWNS